MIFYTFVFLAICILDRLNYSYGDKKVKDKGRLSLKFKVFYPNSTNRLNSTYKYTIFCEEGKIAKTHEFNFTIPNKFWRRYDFPLYQSLFFFKWRDLKKVKCSFRFTLNGVVLQWQVRKMYEMYYLNSNKTDQSDDVIIQHNENQFFMTVRKVCLEGYFGLLCDKVCATHGSDICKDASLYSCETSYRLINRTCEVDLCHQSHKLCKNGGRCTYNDPKLYACNCPERFQGKSCNEKLSPCEANGCQNGGECTNLNSKSRACNCTKEWTGDSCEINVKHCLAMNCLTNRCTKVLDGLVCDCGTGLKGPKCKIDIDECKEIPNLCKNSGKCTNTFGSFNCACVYPYSGKTCDKCLVAKIDGICEVIDEVLDKNDDDTTATYIIIGITVMLSVMLPAAAWLMYKLKGKANNLRSSIRRLTSLPRRKKSQMESSEHTCTSREGTMVNRENTEEEEYEEKMKRIFGQYKLTEIKSVEE